MSISTKKDLFWAIGICTFVFTPCFLVLLEQRGYDDDIEGTVSNMVHAVIYGKEDPVGGDPSVSERLMIYNLLGENKDPEEAQAEADKEAERLANWKANFPYQPTTDPDVVMTEETIQFSNPSSPASIHGYLKGFFQNEMRFTPQFEQLHHILEEHGRGDNPVATGNIFNSLWRYHDYSSKDPDELSGRYSNRMGRYKMNGEVVETYREGIVYNLHAERVWPDREFMPEAEAIMALRDQIIDEIQGMDEIPAPRFTYRNVSDLEVRDSPLVISPGWQAAHTMNGIEGGMNLKPKNARIA